MNTCVFCCQLRECAGRAPWNKPVLETENFVVVPSLGALVDGWSLLLPKQHFISMGALPLGMRAEAISLQKRVEDRLRVKFGDSPTMFEHGPSAEKHGTGCGVDHAHLHILPANLDLVTLAQPFLPPGTEWLEGDWDERSSAYEIGLDYLFLKQDGKPAMLAVATDFGSQVFRKAIASEAGIPSEFNWREFPRYERAIHTGKLLSLEAEDQTDEREYVA